MTSLLFIGLWSVKLRGIERKINTAAFRIQLTILENAMNLNFWTTNNKYIQLVILLRFEPHVTTNPGSLKPLVHVGLPQTKNVLFFFADFFWLVERRATWPQLTGKVNSLVVRFMYEKQSEMLSKASLFSVSLFFCSLKQILSFKFLFISVTFTKLILINNNINENNVFLRRPWFKKQ